METTSTLADTLLDDLDDLDDVVEEEEEQEENGGEDSKTIDAEEDAEKHKKTPRFLDNAALQQHLKTIQALIVVDAENDDLEKLLEDTTTDEKKTPPPTATNQKKTSDDDDAEAYQLIVTSNRYRSQLDDEMWRVHGDLCRLYGQKFPELENLLQGSPRLYKAAVQIIQNKVDLTGRVHEQLLTVFDSNQIITLSVASSTTGGRLLSDTELQQCLEWASYMDAIDAAQQVLTQFVEQGITRQAPSTCALIGPQLTAQLVGLAGGLAELAQIPACNLQVLGRQQQAQQQAAAQAPKKSIVATPHQQAQLQQHAGLLASSDLVLSAAPQYRTKLLKQVAGKVALTARCDAVNVQQGRPRSAAAGDKFRADIVAKLQQWQAPDPSRVQKALPKPTLDFDSEEEVLKRARVLPDLTVKKRRGGKRMRRLKERFEETALMKQANTRSFSAPAGAEYGDDAMGLTLGLLDTTADDGGGPLRKNAGVEKRKLKLANTKAARKQRAVAAQTSQQQQQQAAAAGSSGLASTVAFTPLQAMELVNPDAQKERLRRANQKWFADNAGFQSALPSRSSSQQQPPPPKPH